MYARVAVGVRLRSSAPLTDYTGKVSKTLLARLAPWLAELYEPVRGVFKPFSVSPPIIPGGRAVYPFFGGRRGLYAPVLSGEYVVYVGLPADAARRLLSELGGLMGRRGAFGFHGARIEYELLWARDATPSQPRLRGGETVEVTLLAPTILPDPWRPRRGPHRYAATPSNTFWVPYMLAHAAYTATPAAARAAVEYLETVLRETWSTAKNVKVTHTIYNGHREPTLTGRARYIVLPSAPLEPLQKTLWTATILGTGTSRATGFGTLEAKIIKTKPKQ